MKEPEPDETHRELEVLEGIVLELPYVPDFLIDDVRLWFYPSRRGLRAVYHELTGRSARNWTSYYTNRGWNFLQADRVEADGPYPIRAASTTFDVLEQGWIRPPKPQFRFEPGGQSYPIVSLQRRRPINPWKPNYIQALNFIKKYEWPRPVPRRVQLAIWEIEECGQIAGSTSWINGEAILRANDSDDLRTTLADIFYNRPEDYPLGSEVYLRVLGNLGEDGFLRLKELVDHPVTKKRACVARTLGELQDSRGREPLLVLLGDEDSGVRNAALKSLALVGVPGEDPAARAKLEGYLDPEHGEIRQRVWAAAALLKGGDDAQRKFLVGLVKEENRPLDDMGELGEILADLELVETVPFLIQRLKSDNHDIVMDAADALRRVTGLAADLAGDDQDERKRLAIRSFSRWWEEKKRERSARRSPSKKR